jgi:uncharacterized protein YdaU (DUF1376 family)
MAKGKYYIKLYHQRLLTSTIGWKDEEFGAYLKLLIYQFDKGSIPADLPSICRIAPSAKKHWPLLSQKFITAPGGLINEVMNDVRNDTLEKRSKRECQKSENSAGAHLKTDRLSDSETETKPNGSEKETHTHVSLCISDSALKDGGVGEELIVPAMVKQFKEENPKYFIHGVDDFPAVKELAEKINAWQGLEGDFLSNQKEICRRWGELIVWIKADKHFVKYSLSQINKHFQSIIQSVSNGTYSTATGKTGNRKSEGFEQLSGILRKEITSE